MLGCKNALDPSAIGKGQSVKVRDTDGLLSTADVKNETGKIVNPGSISSFVA